MAQFQPDNQDRPPLWRAPEAGEDRLQWGLDEMENLADRAGRFSLKQYKPRWIRWPRFIRRWYDALPEQVRYRISVIGGFAQTGFLIIAATFSVALIFKAVSNQTILEPSTAQEVFDLVDDPYDVSYNLETVREKPIDGSILSHHTLAVVGVYPKKRLLQAQVSGVAVAPFRMTADGKTWSMAFLNEPNNIKTLGAAPSPNTLRPIYASDLKPSGVAGRIVTSKATVRNKRAWLVTWKPTSALLLRMLDAPLLQVQNADIESIRRGNFTTDYAVATVLRGNRTVAQLDARIRIPDQKNPKSKAIMRILVSYQSQNTNDLESLQQD